MIRLYGNIPNSFKMQNTSLSNSFSSSQNTPSRPSPSAGSPSSGRISALSQRFGRKSEGSPLSNMSPSQSSSPLSAFSLKRSFSNSSCAEESPSNKRKLAVSLHSCRNERESKGMYSTEIRVFSVGYYYCRGKVTPHSSFSV